jgi:hypothetical protein
MKHFAIFRKRNMNKVQGLGKSEKECLKDFYHKDTYELTWSEIHENWKHDSKTYCMAEIDITIISY